MKHRRVLGAALVAALVAAGCGGDDDPDAGGAATAAPGTSAGTATSPPATTAGATSTRAATTTTPSSGTPATTITSEARTASFRGVTPESIKIGVVDPDLDELRELGIIEINRGDPEVVAQALVDEINARGGILGRQLDLTHLKYSVITEASVDAACLTLTEEEEVFAVVGAPLGPTVGSKVTCFTDQHDTIVVGGAQTEELLAQSKAPWVTPTISTSRYYTGAIEVLAKEGEFDGAKLAVIAASGDQGIVDELVLPALEEEDVTPAEVLITTAPSDDLVAVSAEYQVLAERMNASGVDTVLVIGTTSSFAFGYLHDFGFTGTRLSADPDTTVSGAGGFDSTRPTSVYDGIIAPIGPLSEETWADPLVQECIGVFEAAQPGITVIDPPLVPEGEPDWAVSIITTCQNLRLFERIAIAAGPNLTNESFLAAAQELGTFALPNIPIGSLGPDKYDVEDGQRLGVFDSSIGEEGGMAPLTQLVAITAT